MPWTSNVLIPGQQSQSTPALAEFNGSLHMVHAGASSHDIWHSLFDGTAWAPNVRIPDQQSKAPSALAAFGGRLHLVHLGTSSNQLWHSSYDGTRWTTNAKIDGESTSAAPALAEFGGLLHCVHLGSSSTRLYHLTFDGVRWTKRPADPGLDGQRSKGAVALAAHGGVLHLVHQGESSNRLWHSTFDGTTWTPNVVIPGQLSKAAPALASFNGLLHLVHLGDSSNRLWHSTFDGSVWAENVAIPYQLSKDAAALAPFNSRLHLVHLGDSSDNLWHSTSDGVLVRRPDRRVVILDLDGLRWDTFHRHLKKVRDAGADSQATYRFELPDGGSDDTVLGDGGQQLNSGFGELCFGSGNGMADARMALTSYPSFTFPTHGTMYTGQWPGRHGITGHSFIVRDAAPEWDRHSWDSLPRALALQGYCTDETGSWGAFWDWVWGGFDEVSANGCVNRNRGLVSDLRQPTVFDLAQSAGLRSCAVHAFYHGAARPWEAEGRDQWWHYDATELRSAKDVCSDADVDQLEYIDHGALTKASLLLRFRPSTVRVTPPGNLPPALGFSTDTLSGGLRGGWQVSGEAHPDGIPDLISLYLTSVDEASHVDGLRNQETYLAWFDHRLARFVRELRSADPDAWEKTVFAVVADHGHSPITEAPDTSGLPADNVGVVREELLRILSGDAAAQQVIDLISSQPGFGGLLEDILRDHLDAWAEAMNLYLFVREPDRFSPLDVAKRLLTRAMRTEPYGALVLVNGEYQFLARGEDRPVPLTSSACRSFVVPQLDVPSAATAEVRAVTFDAADEAAETALRQLLGSPAAFDVLRIASRVAGLNPQDHRQSPDVILLAPAGRSFTSSPSTHGSFAYPTSRIPMVFCGPGMPDGRVVIDQADLADFTPTVLSLLQVPADGLSGRALLDGEGRPLPARPRVASAPTAPLSPAAPRRPERRVRNAMSRGRGPARLRVSLHPDPLRPARPDETADSSALPVLVPIRLVAHPDGRRLVGAGEPQVARIATARVYGHALDAPWVEADGRRTALDRAGLVELGVDGPVRFGSARFADALDVAPEYLISGVTITLPRIPRWLDSLVDELASSGRLCLDHPAAAGSRVLSGRRFAEAVHGLEGLLTRTARRALDLADVVIAADADRAPRPASVIEATVGVPRRGTDVHDSAREPLRRLDEPPERESGTEIAVWRRAIDRLAGLVGRDRMTTLSLVDRGCYR